MIERPQQLRTLRQLAHEYQWPVELAAGDVQRHRRLYRWATHGCRGVVLQTVPVGGTLCTTRQALEEFFEVLADQRSQRHGRQPLARRQRLHERAVARLRAAGV